MTGTGTVAWWTATAGELPRDLDWLADDERARLAGLAVAKRRADFLLGRWIAKRAVAAQWPGAPPLSAIAIRAAADGAPEAFLAGAPLPLVLSISHSAGRALAAVRAAGSALGADLERVEPRSPLLVDDFFRDDEAAWVAACPAAERDRAITLVWSAKESVLKARRSGLREDPRRVRVELGAWVPGDGAWRRFAVRVDDAALDGWWRDDADYVVTVAGDALAAPPVACGEHVLDR